MVSYNGFGEGKMSPPTAPFDSWPSSPVAVILENLERVLRACGATGAEDLIKAVSRELGFRRTGSRIQSKIEDLIERALQSKTIVRREDQKLQVTEAVRAAAN